MKKMAIIFLIVLGIILIVLKLFTKSTCQRLDCIVFTNKSEFKLKDTYQDDSNVYRALYENKSNLLRVEIRSIPTNQQRNYMESVLTRITSIYANALSPYPGQISDEIACSEEFKPVYEKKTLADSPINIITTSMNERLVMGACTAQQIHFQAKIVLIPCSRQSKVYQLEFISPKSAFEQTEPQFNTMIDSINCK